MRWTDNDTGYTESASTFSIVGSASIGAMREPIRDTRPWYRRWYFGFCRDGELWFGLGPIAVAVTRA